MEHIEYKCDACGGWKEIKKYDQDPNTNIGVRMMALGSTVKPDFILNLCAWCFRDALLSRLKGNNVENVGGGE